MTRFLRYIFPVFVLSVFFISCEPLDENENDNPPVGPMERTVIIYMAAENDLNSHCSSDYNEILTGAKRLSKEQNLILYVDRKSTNEKPYIAQVTSSGAKKVKIYDNDSYSSNPEVMKEVIQWIVKNYPAKSYGLVMWGHSDGTGWYVQLQGSSFAKKNSFAELSGSENSSDSITPLTRAFLYDTGEDIRFAPKWMNIPTFANVLTSLPHFEFIFFDICSMMTAEVAYELRNSCDYIIGAPSEIPATGAPYEYIVSDLFLPTETLCKQIVDDYINHNTYPAGIGVPLSVVKTSNMEAFAKATLDALSTIKDEFTYPLEPPVRNCIYYYQDRFSVDRPMMHDVRDFMFRNLSVEDFNTWDKAYKKTVVYAVHPDKEWITIYGIDFKSFTLSDDNFGGLSMFFPRQYYSRIQGYDSANVAIKKMQWYKIIDWSKWGWDR